MPFVEPDMCLLGTFDLIEPYEFEKGISIPITLFGFPLGSIYFGGKIEITFKLAVKLCILSRSIEVGLIPGIAFFIVVE